jgi:glycosyltransferase involved in cell wall biosynthesis
MLVTNDVTRDARVRKEATSLAGAGYDVRVVGVGDPGGSLVAAPFRLNLVAAVPKATSNSRAARVLANWRGNRALEQRLLKAGLCEPVDVVHANDLDTLPVGVVLAQRLGARLIYDAHEMSSEAVGLNPLIAEWRRRREKRLVKEVDAVVTVNPCIAAEMSARYGVPLPAVVYNGASSCRASSVPTHSPVRVLFQGQFFADRNLEDLVTAMESLRGRAVLTLQGWGEVETSLRGLVDRLALKETVRFVEPVPPAGVVAAASDHDIGVINHKDLSLNHRFSSPNKLFDYMAAGLAIVASDLPVLRLVIEDARCGVLHEPTGPDALAGVLGRLVNAPDEIARMKENAVGACDRYSWAAQEKVLLDVYERVVTTAPASGSTPGART